jgi:phosphatidylglycerol---prolipoprotein diacylglyceryl transferase
MQALIYFIWISLTITGCLIWSLRRANSLKYPLELYFSVSGWLLVLIPLGARIFHVLYEEPEYYAESPLRIFEIWRGGFVYFGGLIFSLLFFVYYFRRARPKSFGETLDFFAPVLCLGTGVGRIACYLQGCCYGRELHAWWSVNGLHPTQLYIFVWEMILLVFLLTFEQRKTIKWHAGNLFLFWMSMSAFGRFVIEFFRDDFRGKMILGLSISQIISLSLIAISFGFLLKKHLTAKPN